MLRKLGVAFVALGFVGCSKSCDRKSVAHDACSIVLLEPRSGPQAAIGEQIERARILVTEELNSKNGAGSIAIREVDTGGQPKVALAEVQRTIAQWGAPIVVGSILSSETRDFLRPALSKAVVLANGSSDPTIRTLSFRHPHDGFFRNWPADDLEGRTMAEYLRRTDRARKLAVFHAADAYAKGLAQAFCDRFKSLGGEILGPVEYLTTATSFDSVVRRLPDTGHDGYYVVGLPPDVAGMYNTIRRSSSGRHAAVFTAVAAETSEFKGLVKFELDNIFFTAPLVDKASTTYLAFQDSYKKKFGALPDIVASITYDALQIAVAAVHEKGCSAPEVRNYLYEMAPYPGVTGPTAFDELGDVISKPVAIRYYEHDQLRLALTAGDTQ